MNRFTHVTDVDAVTQRVNSDDRSGKLLVLNLLEKFLLACT
jgi:hypothetical protein